MTSVTAIDENDDDLTFSISGGSDAAAFTIDAETGALSFIAAPDFEAPADLDGDNVYDVQVTVTTVDGSDSQDIAVTVTDQGFTLALDIDTSTIGENGGIAIGTLTVQATFQVGWKSPFLRVSRYA